MKAIGLRQKRKSQVNYGQSCKGFRNSETVFSPGPRVDVAVLLCLSLVSIWSLRSFRSSRSPAKRWDDRGDPCDQRFPYDRKDPIAVIVPKYRWSIDRWHLRYFAVFGANLKMPAINSVSIWSPPIVPRFADDRDDRSDHMETRL